MFISNYEKISDTKVYLCGKMMADFLIKEGFSLLSYDNDKKKYIFARTKRLDKILNHLPFKLKILKKVGVING